MTHGYPDWGGAAPLATVYSLQDLAELAARLGSIVTFDRRGNVMMLEDFNGSLSKLYYWEANPSYPSTIEISNDHSKFGDFSCKVTTHTQENAGLNIYLALPYPALSKMGVEHCWRRDDQEKQIFMGLVLNDGTTDYFCYVRWVKATETWEYQTTGGSWVALSPTAAYETRLFNHTKLVVDMTTKKYCRLITNEVTYDMTDLPVHSWPLSTSPSLWSLFSPRNDSGGGQAVTYLDSIIVTQNEP